MHLAMDLLHDNKYFWRLLIDVVFESLTWLAVEQIIQIYSIFVSYAIKIKDNSLAFPCDWVWFNS